MGGSLTKTPLQRRNTVLKRSQRKSINKIKTRIENVYKEIKKFDDIEENAQFLNIKNEIETLERELFSKKTNLQPQVRYIYDETQKKIEVSREYLYNKLKENQDLAAARKEEEEKNAQEKENNDVEVIEEQEEEEKIEKDKRKSAVSLNIVQIQPTESKRQSILKIGIPVFPLAIRKKSENQEEIINATRQEIEKLEIEISQFIGHRNGRRYMRLIDLLEDFRKKLHFEPNDDTIKEQLKLCNSYIDTCISFLNERALENPNNQEDDDNDDPDYDDVTSENGEVFRQSKSMEVLSPKPLKTTYI